MEVSSHSQASNNVHTRSSHLYQWHRNPCLVVKTKVSFSRMWKRISSLVYSFQHCPYHIVSITIAPCSCPRPVHPPLYPGLLTPCSYLPDNWRRFDTQVHPEVAIPNKSYPIQKEMHFNIENVAPAIEFPDGLKEQKCPKSHHLGL